MDDRERFARPSVYHGERCPVDEDRQGTMIETPYNEEFLEELKGRWRHGKRYWCPREQMWWVVEGHEEELEELVMEHYGGVFVVDEDGSERIRDAGGDFEQVGLW